MSFQGQRWLTFGLSAVICVCALIAFGVIASLLRWWWLS